ncbi:MAG: hypothetical protein ACPGGK_08595 [Pikeienuella sp.]
MRLVILLFCLLIAPAANAGFIGVFQGIDHSRGMSLTVDTIEDDEAGNLNVKLVLKNGAARSAVVLPAGRSAEGVMKDPSGDVFVQLIDEALGLRLVTVPYDIEGDLIFARSQVRVFVRDGVTVPELPKRFLPAPVVSGGTIDPAAFVDSYAFWPSAGVGYGLEMVRPRYRTLIRLHSVVQTDILWKLCRAETAPIALAEALRGQGVNCQDVLQKIGGLLSNPVAFEQFKSDVSVQRAALKEAIRCSIEYRRNDPTCKRSGALVARMAVSMETVNSVLNRY